MTKIALVTDSAACIPTTLKQELGIYQVPFELVWDGVVYSDSDGFNPTEFYHRFRHAHTYPSTSQPSLGTFVALYTQLAQTHAGIVSIHVSAEMTGTVHTARLAAEQVNDVPICVLDSRTATIAQGFVVLAAARAAAASAEFDQVVAAAQRVIDKVDFFATLKTLEHIHRGGRLGEAAVLLSSRLKITPILNLKNGRVSIVGMTRSWNNALQQILDLTLECVQDKQNIHAAVFHADALQDAEWLRDRLLVSVECVEFYLTEFTPVMGAHTGPDVVGLAFYVDD